MAWPHRVSRALPDHPVDDWGRVPVLQQWETGSDLDVFHPSSLGLQGQAEGPSLLSDQQLGSPMGFQKNFPEASLP